jgi:hypothetical protein
MLEQNILEADLVFIYSSYGILKAAITSLEKQYLLPLADSMQFYIFFFFFFSNVLFKKL